MLPACRLLGWLTGKRRAPRDGAAGPFSVSTGVRAAPVPGERRRGVAPLCEVVRSAPGRRPGAHGAHAWSRPLAMGQCTAVRCPMRLRAWGLGSPGVLGTLRGFLRIVLDGRGLRNRSIRLCAFLHFPPGGPGRPRSRPFSWVTGLLSPAVRSRPWSEVPRRTARSVRLIAPAEPRVVLSGPPLAGADTTPTKWFAGRSRAVRVRAAPNSDTTGLRYDPGTVRAASSRGPYPACPARHCSG